MSLQGIAADNVPSTHPSAEAKNRHGADLNLTVSQAKAAAAKADPFADRSRENAARATREGWCRTSGSR